MSVDTILSWIGAAVAIIAAVAGVVKSFKTTPSEKADVAGKYEAMAARQTDQIRELKVRIDELEVQVDKLEDWAKRLVAHLIAVGEEPDPFEVPAP